MPLPSLSSVFGGIKNVLSGDFFKKAQDGAVVIAAGIAVMNMTDLNGAEKKKALLAALNTLEGDFKIDIPDALESFLIDFLCALGKSQGWISASSPTDSKK